jgi:hypothetical protein
VYSSEINLRNSKFKISVLDLFFVLAFITLFASVIPYSGLQSGLEATPAQ